MLEELRFLIASAQGAVTLAQLDLSRTAHPAVDELVEIVGKAEGRLDIAAARLAAALALVEKADKPTEPARPACYTPSHGTTL